MNSCAVIEEMMRVLEDLIDELEILPACVICGREDGHMPGCLLLEAKKVTAKARFGE